VDFNSTTFNSNAYFRGAVFNGEADFSNAVFKGDAYFFGTGFNGEADFSDAVFNGTADFMDADFNITDFSGAQFNKEAHFENAQFAEMASFDNARFKEDALFENANFMSKLSLSKARYNKLFIRWYNITGGLAYDEAAYMSLMKNFKDQGYYEDYDSCYYNYRVAHRAVPWPSMSYLEEVVRKPIDYLLEWFYGYGTKPFNAALFSLGIVLVFALFWWRVGLGGLKDKTREILKDKTDKGQEDVEDWPEGGIFDILAFSATVFLSGTKLFIDPPPLPMIEGKSRSMIKKAFILERVLGALFSVLFFIAISGTICESFLAEKRKKRKRTFAQRLAEVHFLIHKLQLIQLPGGRSCVALCDRLGQPSSGIVARSQPVVDAVSLLHHHSLRAALQDACGHAGIWIVINRARLQREGFLGYPESH
jgi:hypothetical protein